MTRPLLLSFADPSDEAEFRTVLSDLLRTPHTRRQGSCIDARTQPGRKPARLRAPVDGVRLVGTLRERDARVAVVLAALLVAPTASAAETRTASSAALAAWDDLSHALGTLSPDAVERTHAFPGSPWEPSWCRDRDGRTEVLSAAAVDALFAATPHVVEARRADDGWTLGFDGPLSFEPEDLDPVRAMRVVRILRDTGALG